MNLFNFSGLELLTFFAVLTRFSTLVALLPLTGDRMVPGPTKVLLGLGISIALFPMLISSGQVSAAAAAKWGSTTWGIATTVASETMFGLLVGFVARFSFDTLNFGTNLIGTFMGFASASQFDPHQETNSQVIAEIHMAIAMLIFLALDGHHLMLRAALDSYRVVGLGQATFGGALSQKLIALSGDTIRLGVQIAAPVAVSLFVVNIVFGLMARAMPNLNILVLSFSISAIVGLLVMLMSVTEYSAVAANILERMGDSMASVMAVMRDG